MSSNSPLLVTPETRTCYIVHLEDEQADRKRFRAAFPDISRGLIDFFSRNYWPPISSRPQHRNIPFLKMELKSCTCIEDFAKLLFPKFPDDQLTPSPIACSTLFFVLDFFVLWRADCPNQVAETVSQLLDATIDTVPFPQWLHAAFPHIPVVLLTKGQDAEVPLERNGVRAEGTEQWKYIQKSALDNPGQFVRRLQQFFPKWWEPSFSRALLEYAERDAATSWHTPGHNAGNAFGRSPFQSGFHTAYHKTFFETDLSVSVEQLGDLSEPDLDSPLRTSMQRSSEIFGTADTLFITNGTSTSNKAMLMTLLRPGECVLLDRNCHKSVHQAVVMAGAIPIYLQPAYNKALGVWVPLDEKTIVDHLSWEYPENLKPRMLILTSCTYEGVLYPISRIQAACDAAGILFYADEAWAPYLRFHPGYSTVDASGERFRFSAIDDDRGAHFSVQSTHKALAAFSQASMIHISQGFRSLFEGQASQWDWLRERFSFRRSGERSVSGCYESFRHDLLEVLRYWHSTSPNYPLLATLDRAGLQMRLEGGHLVDQRLKWARDFTNEVNQMKSGSIIELKDIVGTNRAHLYRNYMKDPLKLIIGMPTIHARDHLRKKLKEASIQWEKSGDCCLEFLITIGTFNDHVQSLQRVLRDNGDFLGRPEYDGEESEMFDWKLTASELRMLPQSAVQSGGELVELSQCEGRIGTQMLVPYPPGIPVVLPGLEVSSSVISLISKVIRDGGPHDVHGLFSDGAGNHYVKVVGAEEKGSSYDEKIANLNKFLAHQRTG